MPYNVQNPSTLYYIFKLLKRLDYLIYFAAVLAYMLSLNYFMQVFLQLKMRLLKPYKNYLNHQF